MERLSALDTAFLHLEDAGAPLAIASLGIFEGPVPPQSEIRRAFARKLPLVPRYRQRMRQVPLQLGRPVWVDAESFDIDRHLRRTALPAPGGAAELQTLMGRVMSQKLDRGQPLWEAWVVEGLAEGRWALISKVHHCMVDGVAGMDLLSRIMDPTPEPADVPFDDWIPHPAPSALSLAGAAVRDRMLDPVADVRIAVSSLRRLGASAHRLLDTGRGLVGFAGDVRPVGRTSLHGPVGPRRRYRWVTASISDLFEVRAALGGTLNDVVLAAVSLAFRDLLLGRGEEPVPGLVRTLVPVSVRRAEQRGPRDNLVSAILAELPVELADPVLCLHETSRRMQHLKAIHEAEAGEMITEIGDLMPPAAVSVTLGTVFRIPQWVLTTVTTNVPGPVTPLHVCGRRMLATYPYVPVADRVRISIALTSYEGRLYFGLTGDEDTTPDLDVLGEGIAAAFERLRAEAAATAPEAHGRAGGRVKDQVKG